MRAPCPLFSVILYNPRETCESLNTICRYQPLHGRDQDGDGKDGDMCRLQMQQWLRGNFSYSSAQGDSIPHDIGFRGSKSMMRVTAMSDSSDKLVVCMRLTKAHSHLLKETPGGIDTFQEVRALITCRMQF